MRIVAIVGLLLLQSPSTVPLNLGAGQFTCGEMTSQLRKDRGVYSPLYTSWAQGFFTGANVTRAANRLGKADVDASPDTLLAAIEHFCEQQPLRQVVGAAIDVYGQLLNVK